MKHIPILFSTAMVKAILDGRKTQTRRVVKPQGAILTDAMARNLGTRPPIEQNMPVIKCPYGQPGDVLWVRETWNKCDGNYYYKASQDTLPNYINQGIACGDFEFNDCEWRPSIHMPREAARLFLRIKDVRVERLHEISPESCIAEGLYTTLREHDAVMQLQDQWHDLWESINGQESWEANPFVWVVEFERITREEAAL